MSDYKLVTIDWVDSRQPDSAWKFVSDADGQPIVKCLSAGWLIGQNDEVTTLAPNLGDIDDEDIQVSGVIRIPTVSITRIVFYEQS